VFLFNASSSAVAADDEDSGAAGSLVEVAMDLASVAVS